VKNLKKNFESKTVFRFSFCLVFEKNVEAQRIINNQKKLRKTYKKNKRAREGIEKRERE